ncbi:type VI secretion system protein TssA [Bermanella marisrubri]|uniref:ImpA N-terminal domain-containing protein n=1 Tax=Bermanella marisrubri TaxID=207949 RepID=Q1N506_9GAMM|nr:type VI secretion system protein TssA [Bermanella marisrubri]EAT13272.1 hypothetical protein RED65_00890 [Oceanobacter sp. RED65] [Bermanella marisrubri]QIZ84039.1 type VI secretion system protein TssA [Bermanella marisrubri]
MEVNQSIIDLAKSAISADSPCGINAKYEADFELLEAEVAKAQSLTNETTDWDQVLKLSQSILSGLSKDFTAACYFANASIQVNGYSGMLDGFALLDSLCEEYWQDMFPPVKRLRGRQASCQWLIEQTALFLEQNDPKPEDFEFVSSIASTVKNLDFFLAEKMDDKAPNFADINRPLKRLKELAKSQVANQPKTAETKQAAPIAEPAASQAAPQQPVEAGASESTEPEAQAQTIPAQPTPQVSAPSAPAPVAKKPEKKAASQASFEPVGDIQSDQDAKKAFKQVQDILRSLSSYHSQVKASDPKRYRYSRYALWASLDKLPPAKDGKTQLPSPPADKLKKVVELYESGEYLEAIELAEKSAEKMPYWFDGNRYIVLSMDALGAEFEKAKDALIEQLTAFIHRVPKILDLQYSNGDAFASDQCKTWIQSLMETASDSGNSETDEISEVANEAKKLAMAGKLNDAFELLHDVPAKTKRQKFKVKLLCAELACANGQVKVGIPMLERLLEEVRSLTVADWESDFLSKALALLVNAYNKLDEEEITHKQQKVDAAYEQLCWYNPALITQ